MKVSSPGLSARKKIVELGLEHMEVTQLMQQGQVCPHPKPMPHPLLLPVSPPHVYSVAA